MSHQADPRIEVEDSDDDNSYTKAETAEIRGGQTMLAPLKNTSGVPQDMRPSPPPDSDPHVTTQGGVAQRTHDTTISVPEAGSHPEQADDTIISMHGKQWNQMRARGAVAPAPRQKPLPSHLRATRGMASSLDMVVYFQDKSGIHLTVEDGQRLEAGELFEIVLEEMKFPAEMREVFSLWLVSDLLELQLKPNHCPFKLVCYWEELLEKYTSVDEDDRERDEPVIMFQRNVFYPKWKERKIQDNQIMRLLFYEAKEMVIDGRYPLQPDEYDFLGGLQAQILHKTYNSNTHTPEYYRDKLDQYYPATRARTKWKLPGIVRSKESPEFRLANCHRQCHERFGRADQMDDVMHQLHTVFMETVWELPFYGATFFHGQIEHPGSSLRLWTLDDDPVWVAVNTDGVFVLDMDDVEFLIGLPYQKLSWEYGEPKEKDNPDCMPCLFLSWPAEENGAKVTKMLQVFSKEAVLADAMIEACIGLKQAEKSHRHAGDYNSDMDKIVRATGDTWQRFTRLCVATFSRKGSMLNNPARVPRLN